MSRTLHKSLNAIIPMGLRTRLRRAARSFIPSLRHLDMETRLKHTAALGFRPSVIFDIGAASGDWARTAHEIWPGARIVGFEPNQREVPNLERTKADLRIFDYRRCFLGPSRATISYSDQNTQTSLFLNSANTTATHEAPMLVLDDLLSSGDVPAPDFIKMDVQGYELEVLKGGERALQSAQAVLMEVSRYHIAPSMPVLEDVIDFMRARGMLLYDVMGMLRRSADDALIQMDYFFLRPPHPLWRDSLE